ncbi:MAG: ribosome maturation factor RimP [Fibrobacterota bacterium]
MEILDIKTKIRPLLEELCRENSVELVDIEEQKGQSRIRIFVDKEGGIGLDECAKIHRSFVFRFGAEDERAEKYSIEVSSPGIGRSLEKPDDYRRNRGRFIKVSLYPDEEKKPPLKLTGTLSSSSGDGIVFLAESDARKKASPVRMEIPYSKIKEAKTAVKI